jgi:hypothetical protein
VELGIQPDHPAYLVETVDGPGELQAAGRARQPALFADAYGLARGERASLVRVTTLIEHAVGDAANVPRWVGQR